MVRREAVSAIGRMRGEKAIPFLVATLAGSDPKIVCQAIRGLPVFKGNKEPSLQHAETYPFLKDVAVFGDAREALKLVPNESVHLTFASPPYCNARDYSKAKAARRALIF